MVAVRHRTPLRKSLPLSQRPQRRTASSTISETREKPSARVCPPANPGGHAQTRPSRATRQRSAAVDALLQSWQAALVALAAIHVTRTRRVRAELGVATASAGAGALNRPSERSESSGWRVGSRTGPAHDTPARSSPSRNAGLRRGHCCTGRISAGLSDSPVPALYLSKDVSSDAAKPWHPALAMPRSGRASDRCDTDRSLPVSRIMGCEVGSRYRATDAALARSERGAEARR